MDTDDLSALFFADEESAPSHAAALAKALRGQQQLGQLGMLTGDRVLSGVGKQMLGQAGEREARLAQVPQQRLRMALEKQSLAKGKSELDESTAAASPIYGDLAAKFGFKLPAGMTNASAREALGLAEKAYAADMRARELNLNRSAMADTRADAKTAKQSDADAKDLKELSEDVDKLGGPGFYQKQSEAAEIAKKNPDDLPGFGPLAGRLPDFFIGEEGKTLRQSVGQMLAEYRKGVTGSGMSDTERTEFGQITGLLQSGDEASARQGIERLQRAMDARISNRAAGSPRAAEQFAQRQPWFRQALERSAKPPGGALPQATGRAAAPAASGDVVMVVPPGGSQPVPVHKSKLAAALAAGGRQVP